MPQRIEINLETTSQKDLPEDLAEFMARSQMQVAVAAFTAKVPVAGWHDKSNYGVVAKMI